MKNIAPISFAVLLLSTFFFSCKKHKDPGPDPFVNMPTDLQIKSVDYTASGAHLHYTIIYDASGLVDSIYVANILDATFRTYKYYYREGGYQVYFAANAPVSPSIQPFMSITTEDHGLITNIKEQGTDVCNLSYSGYRLTDRIQLKPTPASTDHYNWDNNGDINSISASNAIYTYSNGSSQTGDALRISSFLSYGRSYLFPNHLVSGYTDGKYTGTYIYQFDSQGRITQLTELINNISYIDTVQYVYTY